MSNEPEIVLISDGSHVRFWCPACQIPHRVRITGPNAWVWNQSVYEPTLDISVLVTSGHYLPGGCNTHDCWCTYNKDHPEDTPHFLCTKCHSFVKDGNISFLEDCSHSFKGLTLPIPPYPM